MAPTQKEEPQEAPGEVLDVKMEQVPPQPPSSNQYSETGYCSEYRHLVQQYDWNVDTMMYAMYKESSCQPHRVGDNYPINGLHAPSCGLLQVRTLQGRPDCETLKDPATNVAWAYKIWQGQGYKAWSVLH